MAQIKSTSQKVVFNTVILLVRLVISTVLVLFSTRIVLQALGNSDYGLFSLLAGLIVMLSFLNSAMSSSTQRFLSFYQGGGNEALLKKIFANSQLLHLVIGLVVLVGILLSSTFLFNGVLNIQPDRVPAAKRIFYALAVNAFFYILSAPYVGAINAHEDQLWAAFTALMESVLKLVVAYAVLFTSSDKLIFYGNLMGGMSFVIFLLNSVYATKKYPECSFNAFKKADRALIREMTSFAGWNLFGIVCSMGRSQGVAIVLNRFFGTIINASYGISNQIASQLNYFSDTLLRAIDPQIMRSEGRGERRKMLDLSMIASKYGVLIMASVGIPIMFEMPSVLHLWLREFPPYTVIFCDLTILAVLMNQETIGLQSAVQAIGKIKTYQIVIGSLLLLNLPLAYCLLRLGFKPYWTILVFVFIEGIACAFRMFFLRKLGGLSLQEYVQKVFLKQLVPIVLNVAISWCCIHFLDFKGRLFVTLIISFLCFILFVYLFGMTREERKLAREMFRNMRNK